MRWLWGSLYALYCLPFAYLIVYPALEFRAALIDPQRVCRLVGTEHFFTPIEGAGLLALYGGGILFVIAALVLIVWHRKRRFFLKAALIALPLAIAFGGTAAMSSAYNEAYFEIYQNHCPDLVSE